MLLRYQHKPELRIVLKLSENNAVPVVTNYGATGVQEDFHGLGIDRSLDHVINACGQQFHLITRTSAFDSRTIVDRCFNYLGGRKAGVGRNLRK